MQALGPWSRDLLPLLSLFLPSLAFPLGCGKGSFSPSPTCPRDQGYLVTRRGSLHVPHPLTSSQMACSFPLSPPG